MPHAHKTQHDQSVIDGLLDPLGYQQITSLSSSTSLTVPAYATRALIQAETQDVRWKDDGSTPTSSSGMLLSATRDMLYTGSLSAIRFIETTASAKLNVSYYR